MIYSISIRTEGQLSCLWHSCVPFQPLLPTPFKNVHWGTEHRRAGLYRRRILLLPLLTSHPCPSIPMLHLLLEVSYSSCRYHVRFGILGCVFVWEIRTWQQPIRRLNLLRCWYLLCSLNSSLYCLRAAVPIVLGLRCMRQRAKAQHDIKQYENLSYVLPHTMQVLFHCVQLCSQV